MTYKNIIDMRGNPNDRIDKLISKIDSLTEQCNFTLKHIITHTATHDKDIIINDLVEIAIERTLDKIRLKNLENPTVIYHKTLQSVINSLYDDNFFLESRSLKDVKLKLDLICTEPNVWDNSAVSHSLLNLMRESKLRRLGKERKYRYINKEGANNGTK